MELRDLPSVDELAREADDPLAVEAARAVIDRAREEIQTGKLLHFPVVLVGEAYWTPLLEWVRRSALADGMVSPADLALLTLTDDPRVALETVLDAFRTGDGAGSPHEPHKADAQ